MADERTEALMDSQYLAGVGAGWNAANSADPEKELAAIRAGRVGHCAALRTPSPPPAPSDAMVEAADEAWRADVESDGSYKWSAFRAALKPAIAAALALLPCQTLAAEGEKPAPGGESVAWRVRTKREDGSWGKWWVALDEPKTQDFDGGYGVEIRTLVDITPAPPTLTTDEGCTPPTAGGWKPDMESVVRAICYWSEPSSCHDAYCSHACAAIKPDDWFWKAADAILSLPSTLEGGE